jgi:lipoate-protein ligase B
MRLQYLGIISYAESQKLQHDSAGARKRHSIEDTLYLLQHEPVITLGRFKGENDVKVPYEQLRSNGISLVKTDRGGGVTYHGPGQIVGYPVINLRENGLNIPQYVRNLGEVIIKALACIGIQGGWIDRYPGVWVKGRKICSIGINVDQSVSTHGFALNVNNDLSYFQYIRPCGLSADDITSVSEQLGHPVQIEEVITHIVQAFSEVFEVRFEDHDDSKLQASRMAAN